MRFSTIVSAFGAGVSTVAAMDDETFYNLELPEFTPDGDQVVDLRFSSALDRRSGCGNVPGIANGECVNYFSANLDLALALSCLLVYGECRSLWGPHSLITVVSISGGIEAPAHLALSSSIAYQCTISSERTRRKWLR